MQAPFRRVPEYAVSAAACAAASLAFAAPPAAAAAPAAERRAADVCPQRTLRAARGIAQVRRLIARDRRLISRERRLIEHHGRALAAAARRPPSEARTRALRWHARLQRLNESRLHRRSALVACHQARVRQARSSPARQPEAAPAALRVGVVGNSQGWDEDAGQQQNKAARLGVSWLREEFRWDVIEPANDRWDWRRYDTVVGEAARRGLTVLPLLMGTPRWAGPADSEIPADPSEFAEYVARVTSRYGPGGEFWSAHPELEQLASSQFEIWNEPFYRFSSNERVDPARYARLFAAAARAGKAANPQAKFLIAAETEIQTHTGRWVEWTDAMFRAVPGLARTIDGVAVHPYSKSYAPDAPVRGYENDKFVRIDSIRRSFARHGVRAPFWITEMGWATCDRDPAWCVSESEQAHYVSDLFGMLRDRRWVQAVFLYHLEDTGSDPRDPQQRYGLMRRDGSPKPALRAVAAALRA